MILPCEPALFRHPGRVRQDGLDLFLGDTELAGYLRDGGPTRQVLKDGVQGQSRRPSLFPAISPSVNRCVTSRRAVVFILVLQLHY